MSNYTAPDVYIKDKKASSKPSTQISSSVGVLIGVARSGVANVAKKVTSWTEFVSNYANGLDTPFTENSYLPYAVHGFFSNGGKQLYIGSVKKNGVKSTKTSNGYTATAISEGEWGNLIKVSVKKSATYSEDYKVYDVTVSIGTSDTATISEVSLADVNTRVLENYKVKQWLSEFKYENAEATELTEEEFTLESGSEGDELTDEDYIKALEMVDVIDDAMMIGIVGQTSKKVTEELLKYCEEKELFPIIDMPMGSSTEDTKAFRVTLDSFTGVLAHPWGKVKDPLTGNLKAVPTVGHLMGVYARVIESRGVYKAPAGIEATVNGFVEMEYQLSKTQIGYLNQAGVVSISARPNVGIVVWGARSLNSSDSTMKYVTDGLLNLTIKKALYNGTLFAVFEGNDPALWSRVQAVCKGYLETLRTSGALKGTKDEAYFVTVDETNNTDETIDAGELHIDIGYAPVKPAEFVIISLAHSIETQQ